MEALMFILIVVWAVVSSVSKSKKAAQKQGSAARKSAAAPRAPSAARTQRAPEARQIPTPRPAVAQGSLGAYQPMQSTEGLSNYQPLQHRLNTSGSAFDYTGSLGGASTEGQDLCDPSLDHDRREEAPVLTVYDGAIGREPIVRFDRGAILQGVVMSEILTRPAQRKRGFR